MINKESYISIHYWLHTNYIFITVGENITNLKVTYENNTIDKNKKKSSLTRQRKLFTM